MVHADHCRQEINAGWQGPTGRCAWWDVRWRPEDYIASIISKEIDEQKDEWPPVKAGLFGGDHDQANTARLKFGKFLEGIGPH